MKPAINPLVFRILYWISISTIFFWVITGILGIFAPVEFINYEIENNFIEIRLYGFPLAVMCTLTGTIKVGDNQKIIDSKFLTTFLYGGGVFLILVLNLLVGYPWKTYRVFFKSKDNPTVKIIERGYSGGAQDGSMPTYGTFKAREFAGYFMWTTKIDTAKINKTEWVGVEK